MFVPKFLLSKVTVLRKTQKIGHDNKSLQHVEHLPKSKNAWSAGKNLFYRCNFVSNCVSELGLIKKSN